MTTDLFETAKLTTFLLNSSGGGEDIFVLAEATQPLDTASYQSRKTKIDQILSIQVVQGSEDGRSQHQIPLYQTYCHV